MVQSEFEKHLIDITPKDKVMAFCDQAMTFSFYGLVFAIPISIAMVECFATLPIIFYLIKRIRFFSIAYKYNVLGIDIFQTLRPVRTPIDIWIVLWMGFCVLSIFVNDYHSLGIRALVGKVLQNVFVFWIFIECMRSKAKIQMCVKVLLASVCLVSVNGIYQHFSDMDFLRQSSMAHGRISSSLREPTDFATYLVLTLPLVLSLVMHQFPSMLFSIFLRFTLLVGVVSLGWTYSRAGWLALFIAAAIVVFYIGKKRFSFFVASLCAFAFFVYFIGLEREHFTFAHLFNVTGRESYWQEAITIIRDHPIFGVGLNAYSSIASDYKLSYQGGVYPHNCYLHMAAEIGIAGLIVFILLLVRFFSHIVRFLKKKGDELNSLIILGLGAGYFAFLLHSFFDTFFYSTQLGVFMWLIMGWLVAMTYTQEKTQVT